MNSTATPQVCVTQPNPDIIGVGIRVSFYILAIVGPLVSYVVHSPEFTASVQSSLGITGLALFLTTVVLTSQNQIDLFHAICIFHLLGLVGISIAPKAAKGSSTARFWVFTGGYVVVLTGSLGYLIFVFGNAPTFGSHPECNAGIKYVLFGINISATNDVIRWIFVATLGLFYLWSLLTLIITKLVFERCLGYSNKNSGEISLWFVITHEIGCIYVIVMLELIIKRNALEPGLSDWTFGQVLAMMMLVGPLIELTSSIIGEKDHED